MVVAKQVLVLAGGVVLAAALFPAPEGARAQVMPCTPTQTVSATADADSVYTTMLTCADTSAAAGAADYERLRHTQSADRDTNVANNNANNHVVATIGPGIVFSAEGYFDHRTGDYDAVVLVQHGGDKTVVVEKGAVLYLRRTPEYWMPTDRPSPSAQYNPAWYPTVFHALRNLAAIHVSGTGDLAVRRHRNRRGPPRDV